MSETNGLNPVCTIDRVTRKITMHEECKFFGVQYDKNVERIYFECPKEVGDENVDITACNAFIAFENANREPGLYKIEDLTADGDIVKFSWLLDDDTTKYKGDVRFIFYITRLNGTNEHDVAWHTIPATGFVEEGLEVTVRLIERDPAIIESMLLRIGELEKNGGGAGGRGILYYKGQTACSGLAAIKLDKAEPGDWEDFSTNPQKGDAVISATGQFFTVSSASDSEVTLVYMFDLKNDESAKDGLTPFIGENGNWWIGEEDTGVSASGGGGSSAGEVCDLLIDVTTTERVGTVSQAIDNVAYKQIFAAVENVAGHADDNTKGLSLRTKLTNADNVSVEIHFPFNVNQSQTTAQYGKMWVFLTEKTCTGGSHKNIGSLNNVGSGPSMGPWYFYIWETNVLKSVAVTVPENTMEVGARLRVWGVRA